MDSGETARLRLELALLAAGGGMFEGANGEGTEYGDGAERTTLFTSLPH